MPDNLPVLKVLPALKKALELEKSAVLQAPPGAGKTTAIPPALCHEPWLKNKKIVMLEPRRLAARTCAAHMACMLGESVGETIGYQIRFERKIGPKTRIEIITEKILTRRLQHDPSLEGTGLVIFDEFHERNINSDLGLSLCLESRQGLREDLRILVMSATMDPDKVSDMLDGAPIIISKGKSFPMETRYVVPQNRQKGNAYPEVLCYMAVRQALIEETGDILIFLPGVREIKRLALLMENSADPLDPGVDIFPLFGNLSQEDQTKAILPSKPGRRKIVIATSVAETSITIEGVTIVIDSGLMRVPRFFSGTGMTRLETVPVSKASADQRRGRAGRTAPGICYRLWTETSHRLLKDANPPEILTSELSEFALELALWGVSDPETLRWMDLPDKASFSRARQLLKNLGALDGNGRITDHGRQMAAAGVHPRLAHMILQGKKRGSGTLACRIAALLSERDFLSFKSGAFSADIRLRLEILDTLEKKQNPVLTGVTVNEGLARRILQTADKLKQALKINNGKTVIDRCGFLLALAYPERVAVKRDNTTGTFLMASGKGAFFQQDDDLAFHDSVVAASLDGNPQNARILLGAPYSLEALESDFGNGFTKETSMVWDKKTGAIAAKRKTVYGNLVVRESPLPLQEMDPGAAADLMIQGIGQSGLSVLPWTKPLQSLRERAQFLKQSGLFDQLPDLSDTAMEKSMSDWLGPFLSGVFSLNQLKKIDLAAAITALLTWDERQLIEKEAPTHLIVPSGSKIPLQYSGDSGLPGAPVLAVRLQELFGLTETPTVARGKIQVTLHLLSPAGRPVQITTDLENFWKSTYQEVKKDLMGRYPKHFWPDDPLTAKPTNRVKAKKNQ